MAEFYRFFDSTLDDPRKYDAEEFAEYFRQILTDGIFNGGTNLQITCDGTNMNVKVNEGYGWIKGYLYKADNLGVDLPLDTADVVHDRIDRIVLRWDKVNRYIKSFVLKGIPASIPVPPELTRNDSLYEISLAQVRVIAGKSFIASTEITDERLDTNVCGLVNSLVQVDTTTMQQEFDNFMAGLQSENYVTQSEFGIQVTDINNKIGDISGLVTTDKSSMVNAVNEVKVQANDLDSQMADLAKYKTATGSNSITITTGGNFELTQGNWIKWIQELSNNGAATINVDGKGAKVLKNPDGTDLVAADLEANSPYEAFYSAGDDFFFLRPKGVKLNDIIAAIESKGGTVVDPQKVAEIENSINDVASWDSDLISSNIKAGVNIFGVAGAVKPYLLANGTGRDYLINTSYRKYGYTLSETNIDTIEVHLQGDIKIRIRARCNVSSLYNSTLRVYKNDVLVGTINFNYNATYTNYYIDVPGVMHGDILYITGDQAGISATSNELQIDETAFTFSPPSPPSAVECFTLI